MTVEYQKVWRTMNDLEMVTSKICSAREIIDAAVDKIQENQYDKAEIMMSAAYEYLEYYLQEFDAKFKLAWQATVCDLRDGDNFQYTATGEKMSVDDCMPPWGHSDMEALKYTDEELDAMCDKAASDQEKELCHEYNTREKEYYEPFTTVTGTVTQNGVTHTEYTKAKIEAGSAWNDGWTREYYQKIVDKYEGKKTLNYQEAVDAGWSMTDDGIWMPPQKEDKVVKWQLPVEQVHDDYFVSFPDDLLEAANLKEGDTVEWVDRGDGSYLLRKVTKLVNTLEWGEC